MGFREPAETWRHLDRLAQDLAPEVLPPFLREVLPPLVCGPDPDLALVDLVRYAEARYGHENPSHLQRLGPPSLGLLINIFGYSQFLAELLIRYPEYLEWLEEDPDLALERTEEDYRRAFEEAVAPFRRAEVRHDAAVRALRRELLRLGVRRMLDFSAEPGMTRELSDLAAASLALALAEITPAPGLPIRPASRGADRRRTAPAPRRQYPSGHVCRHRDGQAGRARTQLLLRYRRHLPLFGRRTDLGRRGRRWPHLQPPVLQSLGRNVD